MINEELRVRFTGDDTDLQNKLANVNRLLDRVSKKKFGSFGIEKTEKQLSKFRSTTKLAFDTLNKSRLDNGKLERSLDPLIKKAKGFEQAMLKAQKQLAAANARQAEKSIAKLARQLAITEQNARKAAEQYAKLNIAQKGFKKTAVAVSGIARATKSLGGGANRALKGFVSASQSILSFGANLTIVAAGARAVITTLGNLTAALAAAASAGSNIQSAGRLFEAQGGSIDRFRKSLRGVVSDADLVKSANLGNTFGIGVDDFDQLAKVAQAASIATGDSVKFLLDSIVRGVARASPLILDNLGIVIKLEEANKAYAKTLDKQVKDLNKVEKAQAVLKATQEAGLDVINKVQASGADLAPQIDQVAASAKNLADEFKQLTATSVNTFLSEVSRTFGEIDIGRVLSSNLDDFFSSASSKAFALGEALSKIALDPKVQAEVIALGKKIGTFIKDVLVFANRLKNVAKLIFDVISTAVTFVAAELSVLIQGLKSVGKFAKVAVSAPFAVLDRDGFKKLQEEAELAGAALGASFEAGLEGVKEQGQKVLDFDIDASGLDDLTDAIKGTGISLDDIAGRGKEADKEIKKIASSFKEIRTTGDGVGFAAGGIQQIKDQAPGVAKGLNQIVQSMRDVATEATNVDIGGKLSQDGIDQLNALRNIYSTILQNAKIKGLTDVQKRAIETELRKAVEGVDLAVDFRKAFSDKSLATFATPLLKKEVEKGFNVVAFGRTGDKNEDKKGAKKFVDNALKALQAAAKAAKKDFQEALRFTVGVDVTLESDDLEFFLEDSRIRQTAEALEEFQQRTESTIKSLEKLKKKRKSKSARADIAKELQVQREELAEIQIKVDALDFDKFISATVASQKALVDLGKETNAVVAGIAAIDKAANDLELKEAFDRAFIPALKALENANSKFVKEREAILNAPAKAAVATITQELELKIDAIDARASLLEANNALARTFQEFRRGNKNDLDAIRKQVQEGDFSGAESAIAELRRGIEEAIVEASKNVTDLQREGRKLDLQDAALEGQNNAIVASIQAQKALSDSMFQAQNSTLDFAVSLAALTDFINKFFGRSTNKEGQAAANASRVRESSSQAQAELNKSVEAALAAQKKQFEASKQGLANQKLINKGALDAAEANKKKVLEEGAKVGEALNEVSEDIKENLPDIKGTIATFLVVLGEAFNIGAEYVNEGLQSLGEFLGSESAIGRALSGAGSGLVSGAAQGAALGSKTGSPEATALATVGGGLLGLVKGLASALIFSTDRFRAFQARIATVTAPLGLVFEDLTASFTTLVEPIGKLAEGITTTLGPLAKSGAITSILNSVIELLIGSLPILGSIVKVAVIALNALAQTLKTVVPVFNALAPVIAVLLELFSTLFIIRVLATVVDKALQTMRPFANILVRVVEAFGRVLPSINLLDLAFNFLGAVLEGIGRAIQLTAFGILKAASFVVGLIPGLDNIADALDSAAQELFDFEFADPPDNPEAPPLAIEPYDLDEADGSENLASRNTINAPDGFVRNGLRQAELDAISNSSSFTPPVLNDSNPLGDFYIKNVYVTPDPNDQNALDSFRDAIRGDPQVVSEGDYRAYVDTGSN